VIKKPKLTMKDRDELFEKALTNRITNKIKKHFEETGKPPETTLDYYKLIKLLGKGSFGKVHLGKEILTD
jgi:hypothetical protein